MKKRSWKEILSLEIWGFSFLDEERWQRNSLLFIIGMFGVLCLAKASLGAYFLTDYFLHDRKWIPGFQNPTAIYISVIMNAASALASAVAVYGILKDRRWAVNVWLVGTVILSGFAVLSLITDPQDWTGDIFAVLMFCVSWEFLWHRPRKGLNRKLQGQ
jgi:uncharacterized membrane protein YfcA